MRAGAVASESPAAEAAERTLKDGGTCVDALIAGFLAAAAARPGALFAPLQALVAGPGAGQRAFDGRARQPGLGVPRPRGVVRGQEIPAAAHAAVPASLAALALMHAYGGGELTTHRIAAPAIEYARGLGATERAAVIDRFARFGATALCDATIARPLVAVAGRTQGGLLSEQDLSDVRPESPAPREATVGASRRVLVSPWPAPEAPQRASEFVAVADSAGILGVIGYSPDDQGLAVPELELTLPRDAVVVRRGVPRVAPGEPLPCAAPIGLGVERNVAFLVFGVRARVPFTIDQMVSAWSGPAATGGALLAAARQAASGSEAHAILRSPETGQVTKLSVME